jgi:hypothetical protein
MMSKKRKARKNEADRAQSWRISTSGTGQNLPTIVEANFSGSGRSLWALARLDMLFRYEFTPKLAL